MSLEEKRTEALQKKKKKKKKDFLLYTKMIIKAFLLNIISYLFNWSSCDKSEWYDLVSLLPIRLSCNMSGRRKDSCRKKKKERKREERIFLCTQK